MVLKFNDDNIISNIEFYYNYSKICFYAIQLKLFYKLNRQNKINNCIYNMCLLGGPIFIKIAQNVANKENIDTNLKNKLLKFQDSNFDYCDKIDSNFLITKYNLDSISEKPIFAGSIAAVYRCKYKNKDCVLKIIHQDIKKKTIMSINLFDSLTYFINLKDNNINQIVSLNELYQEVLNQIDFNLEYNNLMKIKNNFEDFKHLVTIPSVFYYNSEVLIESYEDGLKFSEFINKYPDRAKEAYYLLYCCFFKMFFDNYVHVDFHESNLRFKLHNNKVEIVIFDFGMISEIKDKKIFLGLLNVFKKNIFLADPYKLADFFIKLNTNSGCDIEKFKETLYKYIEKKNVNNNVTTIINNKIKNNDDTENLNPYNVIQYIIDQAIIFDLKICDTVFNLLNSFILVEDFYLKIEKNNSDIYKSYQEKMKYAEKNGFLTNIKNSFNKKN